MKSINRKGRKEFAKNAKEESMNLHKGRKEFAKNAKEELNNYLKQIKRDE